MSMERESRESEQYRKLFIGGLHYETTEDTMKKYFEQWGEIVDCVVMRDSHSGMSRGFGFVTYKKAHMVDDAQHARPHNIDKKEVESKRAMPREDANRPETHLTIKKVYVSGIKDDIDEADLQEYFVQFGNVEEVEIMTEKSTGKKRGFAFITYDDYDPVDKVVLIRHHMIKNYRCDVKKALPKEDMNSSKYGRGFGDRGGRGGGGDSWSRKRGGFGGRDRYGDRDSYGGRNGYGGGRDSFSGGRDDFRGGYNSRDDYGYDDRRGGWGGGGGSGYDDGPGDRWGSGGSGFGSGYSGSSGGGPMRGDGYNSRGSGPYGGGYGSGGSGFGSSGSGYRGDSYGGGGGGYGGGSGGYGSGSGGYGSGSGGYGGGSGGYGGGSGGGGGGGYGGGGYGGGGGGYGGGGGGYGGGGYGRR